MAMYQNLDGVNRRLGPAYVGIDGVRRECDRGFVGIDGKRCQFYGILEGVVRAVFVIFSCTAGDLVDNTDPNSGIMYDIKNEVEGMAAVNSVGSITYGVDASGSLSVDIEEYVAGKTIVLRAYIDVEFDNVRSARLYRIMKHYIAPVVIPVQSEVTSQKTDGSTEALNTGHGVYVGNQSAWVTGSQGLGEINRFSDSVLEDDFFNLSSGIRSGSGSTRTKIILPDGIYIDNNKVPLVIRNEVT